MERGASAGPPWRMSPTTPTISATRVSPHGMEIVLPTALSPGQNSSARNALTSTASGASGVSCGPKRRPSIRGIPIVR